jgi:hypothetical protein
MVILIQRSQLMSTESVEERITRLEQKVCRLENGAGNDNHKTQWWERISGAFQGDLIYSEAMKLARDEREADRDREPVE